MEVVVQFLEGNPDRPLCVGCVYNADYMPPYTLTGNKTQSGIKSRSSTGGGASNFNELRFDDKMGQEEVYFHAEKDFKRVVENNDSLKVGYDKMSPGDQTIEIYNKRTTTIQMSDDLFTQKMGSQTNTWDMGNQTNKLTMGNRSTDLSLGKDEVTAMQSIEFKVGMSSVKIDQTGVTIKGLMINIEGQAMTTVKAPMTIVEGQAMLMLKGGIIMMS